METLVPVKTETLDRWGNVLTMTDPRNATWVTRSRYNSQNQLLEQKLPTVDVLGANGVSTASVPVHPIKGARLN